MNREEIWDALEERARERAGARRVSAFDPPATLRPNDIKLVRKNILDFLENVDGDTTVEDLCEVLSSYPWKERHGDE